MKNIKVKHLNSPPPSLFKKKGNNFMKMLSIFLKDFHMVFIKKNPI